ncbi:nitrogen fixation protein NifQ [Roseospira marina]|uniref:Nitrogen fixation protein NifQ n=1 Tax=Roseospira marina TaxID=140057 RepID=A0A5M6IH57_9PROT|nr:nitrogen fixation protein NifQ [Roseospira marina]KAA5607623.1 nitrogen fixation protein NifQ [Roseospira marina]MBB4312177.1 nitrogen fixation protein NifQ [Roseospira marina]MBB5085807.1 nitrogen fixation protein NifQ [Roseospira marina]
MAENLYDRLMAGDTGDPFDRHVLACVIVSGFAPPEQLLTDTMGLSLSDLSRLMDSQFPHAAALLDVLPLWEGPKADAPEEPDLRALLYDNRTPDGDPAVARWFARIIARRSLGESHLWEDLGLRDRDELSQLMARHFAPLAAKNPGMRWKKFFYRTMCEQEGVLLCKAPNCQICEDYHLCFAA